VSPPDRLLFAIPTYNERENIGSMLAALLSRYPAAHVVVVDDNSPDGTGDVVAGLAAADPRIRLIRRDRKRGLGSAYRAAFAWALEREYAHVLVMDADGSHDPAQIGRLLDASERADVVVGSRYVPGGRILDWPLRRRALSRGGNLLARLMAGPQVRDWTAGFKCYGRPALASLRLGDIRSEGYSFQIEILFHCLRAGWKVHEVPITFADRRLGQTKMSRREVSQAVATLARIAWRRLLSRKNVMDHPSKLQRRRRAPEPAAARPRRSKPLVTPAT
jgi:dolichol-phosphate mannosyltransferase